MSNILSRIRTEIYEHGFDVFISCKSQDYALAHKLYDYLVYNGFKPFLADTSIKEVGIDQYTALIGEVINVCQNMIVFATDSDYIKTPYPGDGSYRPYHDSGFPDRCWRPDRWWRGSSS